MVILTGKLYIVIKFDDSGENIDITRFSRNRKIRRVNKTFKVVKHPDNKSYWQRYALMKLSIVFEDGEVLGIKQPDPHYLPDFQKLAAIVEQGI